MVGRLRDDELLAYQRDGVVCVRQAVSPAMVRRMLDAIERRSMQPARVTKSTARDFSTANRHLYAGDEAFRSFVFESGLAELAAIAMASTQIRLYDDQLFMKPAGADFVIEWHQDHSFWPIEGSQANLTWVALTPANAASSALQFVAGSHRWGKVYRPYAPPTATKRTLNTIWPHFGDFLERFPDQIIAFEDDREYTILAFDVEPGDVLVFDYKTLHRSGPNGGTVDRIALSYRWLGDDTVWSPVPGADPIIESTWLSPGDKIVDDEAFPLAHPAVARVS